VTLSHGCSYFFKIINHPLLQALVLVGYQVHVTSILNAGGAEIRKMCTPCMKKMCSHIKMACLNFIYMSKIIPNKNSLNTHP
jgi:hypothetical protein